VEGSQYQYDALVSRAGCSAASDTLTCLRGLSESELKAINFNIPTPGGTDVPPLYMYSNVVDGDFTPDFTYKLYEQGKFIRVPVIFGYDLFFPIALTSTSSNQTIVMIQTAVQSSLPS
jgi:hypothetical protein